ncbi:Xanthine_oxidase / Xanthine dehydrogenase [Hexamita inflata]|uniref:Xanthine oxidase / Xanthine dehydrogenase n=1 Tax=Hexamita inflata TaxID=28002 RepID=A0AA86TPP7_9EUKA|nr:Xanthine oxidase / Xanthine dehydrogenase [Hexamita inflata]
MTVVFHLNGKLVQLYKPDPLTTLLEFLRQRKLYGTRVSDGNGIFGCDIVTVVSWDHHANKPVYKSIGALHYPLVYCHGKQIFTVEGIGNKQMLHPIQEQFLNCESFQCGYCAGGFTMAMYTLLRKDSKPSEASIMEALDGNMCRCTAFHPIAAAVASFSSDIEDKEMPICTRKVPFHPENEPEFPAELKNVEVFDYEHEQISPENGKKLFGVKYFTPKTIEELKNTLKENKVNVKMISGASSHQLSTICDNSKANEYTLLSLNNVVELQISNMKEKHIELGSQLTYADVMEFFKGKTTKFAKKLVETLTMFRNTPLRNAETIGAGIAKRGDNDFNLILAAVNAKVQVLDSADNSVSEVSVVTHNKMMRILRYFRNFLNYSTIYINSQNKILIKYYISLHEINVSGKCLQNYQLTPYTPEQWAVHQKILVAYSLES